MKKITFVRGLAFTAAVGFGAHVVAAPIVEYVNPVSSSADGNQNFAGLTSGDATVVTNGSLIVKNWLPSSAVMDSTVYPSYLSHPLYVIAQTGDDGGPGLNWQQARLFDAGAMAFHPQMIVRDSDPANTLSMSTLLYIQSEDFSNVTGGKPLSELSVSFVDTETQDAGAIRFAIRNSGQWYVSAANSSAGAGTLTLANPEDANQWGAITPATPSSSTVVTPAGVTFDTAGSALTNIEAIGIYFDARDNAPTATRVRFRLTELTADVEGSVPSSDSARVLASNVDGDKSNFEYVGPGVALDLSLNAALDGAESGGSTDESYGSFFDPSGAVATPDAYPWRAEGSNSLVADLTITNTSSSKNLKLDGLYFDVRRVASTAVRQVKLDYIAGDLGATGQVYNTTLNVDAATTGWESCDLTLTVEGDVPGTPGLGFSAMSDVVLGTNQTATFRLTIQSSTDAATEPDQLWIDNLALIGDAAADGVLVDWASPGMFFGSTGNADLRKGPVAATTNGTLKVGNLLPGPPLMDRTVAGYYQAQPLYGILQTGNDGALSVPLDFAFARIRDAEPDTGELTMSVEPSINVTDVFQSSLIFVEATDFYDEPEPGEVLESMSLNVTTLEGDAGSLRFAVRDGGQWYLSLSRAATTGVFRLSLPAGEDAWGAFTPATPLSTEMMTAEGVVFNTDGLSLTNIDAVGYFYEGEDLAPSVKANFRVDAFTVRVGPAPAGLPDPSVLAYNVDDVKTDFEYVKSGIDLALNLVSEGNSPSTTAGSIDGSLGSFFDPVSADTNSTARPWAGRGNNPLIADITVGNAIPDSTLELDGFYFDLLRTQAGAVRRIELEYLGGDLVGVSSGLIYGVTVDTEEFVNTTVTNVVEGVTNIVTVLGWVDFDWTFASEGATPSTQPVTFNALGDVSLSYGESATFRYSVKTSTTDVLEPNQARMDNLAFRGHVIGMSGFDGWITGFGLSPDDRDPGDDPDGDGVSNLYEYGLNGNPNDLLDRGTSPTLQVVEGGGSNGVAYTHPQRSEADSGLFYYLELTDDLVQASWTNSGYLVIGTNVTGGTLNQVTNAVETATEDEKFIRLIIEEL